MDQRDFENGMNGRDALDADGGKVATLLRALPRVEAPANFEFGVKARIASGPAATRTFLPFLKIAAPVSLLLLVGAFVIFYSGIPERNEVVSTEQNTPTVVESTQPAPAQTAPPVVSVPRDDTAGLQPEPASDFRISAPRTTRTRKPATAPRTQSGSVDFSLKSANTKLPPGFESVNPRQGVNANVGGRETAVGEVLVTLGINAEAESGGWKVRSVTANSMGQRSGVEAGDLIQAIDDTPLTRSTTFKGVFAPKAIKVRRDGKSLSLALKN